MTEAARDRIDRAAHLCGLNSDDLRRAESAPARAVSKAALLSLRDYLVCPSCREGLAWREGRATCLMCATEYPVIDGIPLLRPLGGGREDTHKEQQARFFDAADAEFEVSRPHGTPWLYRWLLGQKFQRSLFALPGSLEGATAVAVCGGSGMDAEFLARTGARVITLDISLGSARRARARAERYRLAILPAVADAEALPLRDRSVDLAYVHDGLHHLKLPALGLAEMARVALTAVSVNEPVDAALTHAAMRMRLSVETEEAGNRVERVRPGEIVGELERAGFCVVRRERYAMVYRHEPGLLARLLSLRLLRPLVRTGFRVLNAVLGAAGNKLSVQAIRAPTRDHPGGACDLEGVSPPGNEVARSG